VCVPWAHGVVVERVRGTDANAQRRSTAATPAIATGHDATSARAEDDERARTRPSEQADFARVGRFPRTA
jgi:hypothetical protein